MQIPYLKRIAKNKNLADLLKGSSLNSVAKVVATFLGFMGSILVGKLYGAEMLGKIATLSSMFALLAVVSLLGSHTYLLKLIPQQIHTNGYRSARAVYHKILKILVMSTCAVLLGYWISSQVYPKLKLDTLVEYQFLLYALVVVTVIKRVNVKALRALGDYKIFSLMEVLPTLFMLIAVGIAGVLSIQDSSFIYLYYVPHFLVVSISLWVVQSMFKKNLDDRPVKDLPSVTAMFAISLPMFGVSISNSVIATVDVLMINHYLDDASVGIYSIYIKFVALPLIVTSAINSMFAPKIAALHTQGKLAELKSLTKTTTLIAFASTVVIALSLLLVHKIFFGFYGSEFNDYLTAFYFLLAGTVANSAFGSIGFFLSMTGQHKAFFVIMVSAAIFNTLANMVLIPSYGIAGAGMSTFCTIILWNSLSAIVMKRTYGYTTFFFDLPFLSRTSR